MLFPSSKVRTTATARPSATDCVIEEVWSLEASRKSSQQEVPIPHKTTNKKGKQMKKVLLIALAAGGLAFVPVQRCDAQITRGLPGVGGMSFGFPGGYYAYPTHYNYYPYGYYMRPYYSYSQPYSYYYAGRPYYGYNGHRTYSRHHRHHYYHHY